MIDQEMLVKIFKMKCARCSISGHLGWLIWGNVLYDEKKNEMICWGCGHKDGILKVEGPHDILLNPEYRRAR